MGYDRREGERVWIELWGVLTAKFVEYVIVGRGEVYWVGRIGYSEGAESVRMKGEEMVVCRGGQLGRENEVPVAKE